MLFSSMLFLWLFLPAVFVLYRLVRGRRARNALLLAASLLFYAWGEPKYILLMLASILLNWSMGLWIGGCRPGCFERRLALAFAVASNLALLGYFKYFDLLLSLFNALFGAALPPAGVALPIGISFYTFQSLSYIIDLYRGEIEVQRSPFKLGLYICFFPQLIAGPIVNYREVSGAIDSRALSPEKTACGIKRFIYGLGKKVILSNQLAGAADGLFGIETAYAPAGYLWLAAVLYMFQIYYDFSGYSDMAIGLGKMFGFDFPENFNYPYLASSVTDFWRRWHITLTRWFRSYVYIPLGGNRRGRLRTLVNIGIVFALTGLWHGAGLCFIAWGLWHGAFMILERMFLKKWLDNCRFRLLPRLYTLFVVLIGWVFFRAGSLSRALQSLAVMFSFRGGDALPLQMFAGAGVYAVLAASVLLCGPVQALFPRLRRALYDERQTGWAQILLLCCVLFVSITFLVSGTYNPFIYFRF